MLPFPRDKQVRKAWVQVLGHQHFKPGSRICEVHFKRGDWKIHRKILNPLAVPSLFCVCLKCESNSKKVDRQTGNESSNSEMEKLQALALQLEADLCALKEMIRWQGIEIFEEQVRSYELNCH